MRTTILLLLAAGCGPTFKLGKPGTLTCGEAFHTWGGGLTNHVQQGNGNGEFDYVPLSPEIQRIYGSYGLKTGDFFWWEEFIEAHQIESKHAVGYGTLWEDGDLSVEYVYEVIYDDDRKDQFDVRELRLSCEVNRRVEDEDGNVYVIEGAYQDGGFVYDRAFVDGLDEVMSSGRLEPDGSWVETMDVQIGAKSLQFEEVGDGEGYARRELVESDLTSVTEGYWEVFLDGTRHAEYTWDPSGGQLQAWEFTVDAVGTGEGTLEFGQNSCDLVFEEGACRRRRCSDDSNGECSPPVEVPRYTGLLVR